MVRKCDVCALTNHRPSSRLYGLPKNEITARRLLHQLGFDESFTPKASFKVCSKHFTADSFKGTNKHLNEDPVVVGFEKTELTRDSLRGDDGKRYKLVEAPDQDPGLAKKVMILKEATPPPKLLPVKTVPYKEYKREVERLKKQLQTVTASSARIKQKFEQTRDHLKTIKSELSRLFKQEKSWSEEFHEKVQEILRGETTEQSARSESESENEPKQPSPKRSRIGSIHSVAVKQEPKYELEEHYLCEDENTEPDQMGEEFHDEPKIELV